METDNKLYPIELDLAIFSQRNYSGMLNLFFSEADQATKWVNALLSVCGSHDIEDHYVLTRKSADLSFRQELAEDETITLTAMQKRLNREVYVRVISKAGKTTEGIENMRLDIQKHTLSTHYGVRRLLDYFEDK